MALELLFRPYTRKVLQETAMLSIHQRIDQLKRQQQEINRKVDGRDVPLATSTEIADMCDLDYQIAKLESELKRF